VLEIDDRFVVEDWPFDSLLEEAGELEGIAALVEKRAPGSAP